MKLASLITIAWATLAATPAFADAPQEQLVPTFLSLCAETRADPARALAVADHDGWTPPLKPFQPPAFLNAHFTHLDTRFLRQADGVRALLVGGNADPGGRTNETCDVTEDGDPPASPAAIAAALEAWVGGPPFSSDITHGYARFAFREDHGQRRPLATRDLALSADIPPPGVVEVSLQTISLRGATITIISYATWR